MLGKRSFDSKEMLGERDLLNVGRVIGNVVYPFTSLYRLESPTTARRLFPMVVRLDPHMW